MTQKLEKDLEKFSIYLPISKIDKEKRMVYGFATTEDIDQSKEIVDYEASKRAFAKWVKNVREMHQPVAVGKALEIIPDDTRKGIWVGTYVSKGAPNTWEKVLDGTLQGYSIGGVVLEKKLESVKIGDRTALVPRIIEYDLKELSLVDSPCNASCGFEMVKFIDESNQLEITENVLRKDETMEVFEKMTFLERWKAVELPATLDSLTSVFKDTVYEILFNGTLTKEEKVAEMDKTLAEFHAVVSEKVPDAVEFFSRCITSVLTGELLNKLNEVGGIDLVTTKATENEKVNEATPQTPEEKVSKVDQPKEAPKVDETPKAEEKVEKEAPKAEETPKEEKVPETPKEEKVEKVDEVNPLEKRISDIEKTLGEIVELMKQSAQKDASTEKVDALKESVESITKRFDEFMGEPAPRKEAVVVEKQMVSDQLKAEETPKEEKVSKVDQAHAEKVKGLIAKKAATLVLTPEEEKVLEDEFKRLFEEKENKRKQ